MVPCYLCRKTSMRLAQLDPVAVVQRLGPGHGLAVDPRGAPAAARWRKQVALGRSTRSRRAAARPGVAEDADLGVLVQPQPAARWASR